MCARYKIDLYNVDASAYKLNVLMFTFKTDIAQYKDK